LFARKAFRPSLKVDQTLSFNDSGYVLCELLGIRGFQQKVAGLAKSNLVHQGAELAYLLRHDPQFRGVRREHLREVGKRLRLKDDLHIFAQVLRERFPARFHFCVISGSPREVVQSPLEGIVPAENLESLRKDPRSKPSFSDLHGPVTKTTTADPPSDGF